ISPKPVKTVLGANPDVSMPIFRDAKDGVVAQARGVTFTLTVHPKRVAGMIIQAQAMIGSHPGPPLAIGKHTAYPFILKGVRFSGLGQITLEPRDAVRGHADDPV